MLDSPTKHRIDNARDVLVGKVPDPKAQVEQITTALIYKFMDDMDQESVGMGGQASFFVGAYEKYAWPKIMAKTLSGYERLGLYSEAITEMNQNPHLPQLFRDVFKDAFLPYKDPETLNLFLKEIDGFKYDHSERLGDAFEYLLSVLGSQGAAGQFRTPRHIIDFIVEAVGPGKTDTVLDPACGTAGFLISAYKHILAKHQEKKLSPDEMAQLTKNFVGYDIAPEMVRLSLVNMYLHKFPNPTVYEYDTLTSEERWDDSFDVILANPPFMTPKGGIRPHTRFSVRANRSEVLFVDYIAEHLNPEGRAGVIVPEGIIFQSNNAYKALRKMLIEENYLYAVVSLPAGVFNPYSGVKTSILLMDKKLAKQTDKILFVTIENDGYDLGAQRGDVLGDDLPEALNVIREFQIDPSNVINNPDLAIVIEKSKIAEDGDFNLSASRYKATFDFSKVKWPLVELENLISYIRGVTYSKSDEVEKEGLIVLRANNINLESNSLDLTDLKRVSDHLNFNDHQKLFKDDIFICSASGSKKHIGKVAFIKTDLPYYIGGFMAIIRTNERVLPKYLFELLKDSNFRIHIERETVGVNIRNIKSSTLNKFTIPLPPLDVQREIAAEIDGYQKVIDGARQVVENYTPRIQVDPEWPMVELGEVCEFIDYRGKTPQKTEKGTPLITAKNVKNGYIQEDPKEFISDHDYKSWMTRGIPNKGDVLFTTEAPLGNVAQINTSEKIALAQRLITLVPNRKTLIDSFLMYILLTDYMQNKIIANQTGSTVYGIKAKTLKKITIPIPKISKQKQIVEKLLDEQKIVDGNKKLINIFEKKIEEKIGEVWGE
ncbi:MAG: N-6 DNA methylase [Pelolinea sp.]|nr:N-6 DNA methylase [Pelolinea sp.]